MKIKKYFIKHRKMLSSIEKILKTKTKIEITDIKYFNQ